MNVVMGFQAMRNSTTGPFNTAIGGDAMCANTTGDSNVAIGTHALDANTTADRNTAVGYAAQTTSTTGCCNTALGYSSLNTTTTGDNNIGIGYIAISTSATVSDEITLGNADNNNLRCNDTSISSLSDLRDKENIEDIPHGLDYILALRPVKFDWNRRDGSSKGKKDYGFIAQELDKVEEKFGNKEYTRLVNKENPDRWEADPMKTYPILIKAIQELTARIEELENE